MHSSALAVVTTVQRFALKYSALCICALMACGFADSASAAPPADRHLAAGVLTTIAPSLNPEDTVSTHDIMEIRADAAVEWKPEYLASSDTLFGMADKAKFRREI